MFWRKKLIQLIAGALFSQLATPVLPPPSPLAPPPPRPAGVNELLSYQCAKSVTTIVAPNDQLGPLFSEGPLLFTSLEAQDGSVLLLVNTGGGNYVLPLEGAGVNRIRFELPTEKSGVPQTFFLSYLHGGTMRSRYFEYSSGHAPAGRDELDYALVRPARAEELTPHLDYAIGQTALTMLQAVSDGRLARKQLLQGRVENCEHIAREAPGIARVLKISMDRLESLVINPSTTASLGGRMPASIVVH